MPVLVLLLFSLPNYSPASRSSFGAGQVRKSEERPLNQPSQYFSVLDSSTRQVKKLSFFNCRREINTLSFFVQLSKPKMLKQQWDKRNLLVIFLHPFLIRLFFCFFFIFFFFYDAFTNAVGHPWTAGRFLTSVNVRTEQINKQCIEAIRTWCECENQSTHTFSPDLPLTLVLTLCFESGRSSHWNHKERI